MSHSQSSQRRVHARERRAQAIELRRTGLSYARIGEQLGISAQAAHKHVQAALEEIARTTEADARQLRLLELDRLDRLLLGVWARATSGDHQAVRSALAIMERRARLEGLDRPVKNANTSPDGDAPAEAAAVVAILPTTAAGVDEWLARYRHIETPAGDDDG